VTPPYHALTFDDPAEAAAFVAALSRWLASPSGEAWVASNPAIDVRAVNAGEGVLTIYLNQPALDATVTGLACRRAWRRSMPANPSPPDSSCSTDAGTYTASMISQTVCRRSDATHTGHSAGGGLRFYSM
jgi:hypothetical protein